MASQSQALRFKQTLLKVASHPELLKRLKALHDELRDFDQDVIDPSSLDKVAKELIHPSLLLHKDKGVKAYAGCCIVDILRLYAPEAPYTQAELQNLFEFLVTQFRTVGNPKADHQAEYFYIVDSLATVKSIVLVCDLESGSEQLVEQIFTVCFDAITPESPKNVEIALSDILLSLIEELSSLPHSVTRILVSHFQPKTERSRAAAFDLAVEVCKGSSDKLQRYVSQYFAEVIQDAIDGRQRDSDSEDEDADSDSEDDRSRRKKRKTQKVVKGKGKGKGKSATRKGGGGNDDDDEDEGGLPRALVAAHEMIESLNRHVPSLLLNVIPLLSSELTSTASPEYRRLATTCLGDMFADKRGAGDLAASFPAVWKEWTKRTADVAATVRIAIAGRLRKIWTRHAELGPDIEVILHKLLADSDEKVRIAACQTFESMDYETACHHVSTEMLKALGERTVDRKEKVRQIAYRSLGRFFSLAYAEIEAREEIAISQFGWIPGRLLDGLAYSDGTTSTGASASQLHLVDQTFSNYILPLPSNEATIAEDIPSWVDRFLQVDQLLDDPATSQRQALLSLTRLQEGRGGSLWEAYLQACQANNGGTIDDKEKEAGIKEFLSKTIKVIASKMPDPTKASTDLRKFATQNEGQAYRDLKVLLDPQTDLKTYVKTEKQVMKRIKEKLNESAVSTFTSFVRLSCYTMLNRSSVPHLLKRLMPSSSTSEAEALSISARRILTFIAKTRPILFKSHVAELTKLIMSSDKDADDEKTECAVETALHALGKLKIVDQAFVLDSKLSKRAVQLAKEAKTVGLAKYSATLVALDRTRSGAADDLVEFLSDALPEDSSEDLRTHLAALAKIAKYGHESFETKSEQITVQCLEILKRDIRAAELPKDEGATWIEDVDLHPLTSARLNALKVLTNRCIPFANTDSSKTVADPVFGLLWDLIESGRDDLEAETIVSSRLRLASTLGVLKLLATKDPVCLKNVIQHFALLARTAQDTCFEVRDGYLRKLLQCLRLNRLHVAVLPLFHMSLFLIAHEPDEDLRLQVVQFVKARSRRPDRQTMWELPFVRLFSLLAHHPDFEGEHSMEEYRLMAKYFELYLECLATNENISLLYHLAQLIKGARDSVSSSFDSNLYTLSELAQHLVKSFAERHNWPLTTLPKSSLPAIKLPGDAFKGLSDSTKAKEIGKTVYLSEEVFKHLETKEKKTSVPRKRKATTGAKSSPKKKRVSKTGSTKSKSKKRSANEWDSDGSAQEPSAEEDDDDDDDQDGEEGVESDGGGSRKGKARQQKSPKPAARKGLRAKTGRKSLKEADDEDEEMSEAAEEEEKEVEEEDEAAMSVDGEEGSDNKGKKKTAPAKKEKTSMPSKSKSKSKSSPQAAKTNKTATRKKDEREESTRPTRTIATPTDQEEGNDGSG